MTPALRFQEFVEAPGPVDPGDLFAFFDGLEPVEIEAMFGDWDGGVLLTGHDAERSLGKMRWVGKTFHDADRVDPIIARSESGEREVSDVMGKASLRMIRYRGVVTATMVYDRHPIFDYFRRIADDLVLGVMHRKADASCLFFWLRRTLS